MTKEDIEHLASLARIKLADNEISSFAEEVDDILAYVAQIRELAGDDGQTPQVGALHNVFRDDTDPHEPGIYTDALLSAAPKRTGAYIEVKKVIDADAN